MIIENKDNKSNPLRMRLITTFQTTVKQFFRDTFFHIAYIYPCLYHTALTVWGQIVLTVMQSPPKGPF